MGLIDQYRQMMAKGHFNGLSVLKFKDEIGSIIAERNLKTLLDYGSGQGHQYMPPHDLQKEWDVDVTMYDPSVSGLDTLPYGKFDIVICSDVLEHIPLLEIPALLDNIFSRAKHFVFLTVCCRGAKKILPNGQNAHVTIMPLDWWEEQIKEKADVPFVLRETP